MELTSQEIKQIREALINYYSVGKEENVVKRVDHLEEKRKTKEATR